METHHRLIVINSVYATSMSHIQSYINSMRNIVILIVRRSIEKEKSILPLSMHNIVSGKEDLLTHEGMNNENRCT